MSWPVRTGAAAHSEIVTPLRVDGWGGTTPAAARRFVFLWDPSISLNNKDFPTCASSVVRAQGPAACPAESHVGGGTSTNLQGETTPVYLLNTRYANGAYGLIVSIPAAGVVLDQTLEKAAAPYRHTYKLAMTRSSRRPPPHPSSAPAPPASN